MPNKICVLGHHELDYPRNQCIQKLIALTGREIILCHSRAAFPWRHFILAWKYLKVHRQISCIWITEGGHRLVPWIKLFALLTHKKIVFDPFISRYNTRIEDRQLYKRGGLQAWICLWQDWSGCFFADYLIFDTAEHKHYFYHKYHLSQPFTIIPVGVDENIFHLRKKVTLVDSSMVQNKTQILFYGSYIPLQGIDTILKAAEILKDNSNMAFTLIGKGQTYAQMRALAQQLKLTHVGFLDWMTPEELALKIQQADICLGIFGDTVKAGNVVPNKIVQCAAMGKAMITRDSEAIRHYFQDQTDLILVPAANAEALCEQIKVLCENSIFGKKLEQNTRIIFENYFSLHGTLKPMERLLKQVEA